MLWEDTDIPNVQRAKCPGGWLYLYATPGFGEDGDSELFIGRTAMTFVPLPPGATIESNYGDPH